MSEIREDEYIDPADGLLHCRRCGGQRQVTIELDGRRFTPRCVCSCQREAQERQKKEEEQRQRLERIQRRKTQGLHDRYLYDCTFANDNGQNPATQKARAYVDHWPEVFSRNIGLLLFGDIGMGKSFLVGCIANALIDRGIPVLMTNLPTILSHLGGALRENNIAFLSGLDDYDLLILDDLGAERSTGYAMEQVFNVIDGRYRCRKPMIITTNLKLEEMKSPPDLLHARVYDRILERCAPILIDGRNFREERAEVTKAAARQIITQCPPPDGTAT